MSLDYILARGMSGAVVLYPSILTTTLQSTFSTPLYSHSLPLSLQLLGPSNHSFNIPSQVDTLRVLLRSVDPQMFPARSPSFFSLYVCNVF